MLSRNFNTVLFDLETRTVTKSSNDKRTLEYEIKFYNSAPYILRTRMPRLLGYSDDFSWYKMEYLEGESLGDLCLDENLSKSDWKAIFKSIGYILNSTKDNLEEVSVEFLYKIFVDKAIDRIQSITDSELYRVYTSPVRLNNKTLPSILGALLASRDVLLGVPRSQIVLHGDMCFSNVLYDATLKEVMYVDPRGGFDTPTTFGPVVYDIAKMSQSVYGLYEQILGDRYQLGRSDYGYHLSIDRPKTYKTVESEFTAAISKYNLSAYVLKVLSGIMLAGTPPLHAEDKDRSIALALRAVELMSTSK